MGKLFQQVGKYCHGEFYANEVIVELGSDRYEGSTAYFADLAITHHSRLITVDIDSEAYPRIIKTVSAEQLHKLEFCCAEAVSWTQQFALKQKSIKILYLDNFDWDWEVDKPNEMIVKQKKWYRDLGIDMNNLSCQASHLNQMINLLPNMATQSIVCIDDTYEYNGIYIGKGGAVVPYLILNGYSIIETGDYGLILGRNLRKNTL